MANLMTEHTRRLEQALAAQEVVVQHNLGRLSKCLDETVKALLDLRGIAVALVEDEDEDDFCDLRADE